MFCGISTQKLDLSFYGYGSMKLFLIEEKWKGKGEAIETT